MAGDSGLWVQEGSPSSKEAPPESIGIAGDLTFVELLFLSQTRHKFPTSLQFVAAGSEEGCGFANSLPVGNFDRYQIEGGHHACR
jgi:hypothetical protein